MSQSPFSSQNTQPSTCSGKFQEGSWRGQEGRMELAFLFLWLATPHWPGGHWGPEQGRRAQLVLGSWRPPVCLSGAEVDPPQEVCARSLLRFPGGCSFPRLLWHRWASPVPATVCDPLCPHTPALTSSFLPLESPGTHQPYWTGLPWIHPCPLSKLNHICPWEHLGIQVPAVPATS